MLAGINKTMFDRKILEFHRHFLKWFGVGLKTFLGFAVSNQYHEKLRMVLGCCYFWLESPVLHDPYYKVLQYRMITQVWYIAITKEHNFTDK